MHRLGLRNDVAISTPPMMMIGQAPSLAYSTPIAMKKPPSTQRRMRLNQMMERSDTCILPKRLDLLKDDVNSHDQHKPAESFFQFITIYLFAQDIPHEDTRDGERGNGQ